MNRLLIAVLAPLIAAGVIGGASAQPRALDTVDPRLGGYPELTIRLTEERIEAPDSIAAGRTVIVEENATDEAGHAFIFRIPDDVSEAAVAETLAGPSAAEETPEWFWRSEFLGNGDRAAPDKAALALVDLEPGRYIAGDPYRPASEYARFEVTASIAGNGELTAGLEADVVGELFEMGFTLPNEIPAGQQVWQITNTGAMLHEIAIFPVPANATKDQVEAAITAELEAEFGGDPAQTRATIDALGMEWVGWSSELVAGVGVLSPRRVSWAQFDLEPGTYGAVCFVPEPNSMTSHVMFGMADVFTVEAAGA
jgi:hypothetical protein